MRGISLEEIAEHTKIGTRLLKALEEEQFDLLPGGIFNKGFVRAYASYVSIDEEQAVADYLQAAGGSEPDVALIAQQSEWNQTAYREAEGSDRNGLPLLPAVILLLAIGAVFGGWKIYQRIQQRAALRAEGPRPTLQTARPSSQVSASHAAQDRPISSASKTPAEPPAANVKSSSALAAESTTAAASGFEVVVKTTGRTWMSIKSDGKYIVRGALEAGQVRNIHADKEVVVWTGSAGSTEVSFQGQKVPVEGGPEEPRVLVFHPDGLKESRKPAPKPASPVPDQPPAAALPAPQ